MQFLITPGLSFRASFAFAAAVGLLSIAVAGCGTTTQRVGTEQLLMSDAVDIAVSQIDFSPLAEERVYLDSSYLQSVKGFGFVNAPYIVSSLRQQLTAAGCLLQDNRNEAEIVVEARVGALGTDGHEVIYGVPKNNLLNSAATVLPNAPPIPAIPELSAARIDAQTGIAKLLVFAYDSETRERVWQSGVARAESSSRNSWVLGAGPFQRGSVHTGIKFAGEDFDPKLEVSLDSVKGKSKTKPNRFLVEQVGYFEEYQFDERKPDHADDDQVVNKPEDADDADDG